MQVRVVADHDVPRRAPLHVAPGDRVRVGQRSPDWPAFVFVTGGAGQGWVPERLLDAARPTAAVLAPYDTTELRVVAGQRIELIEDDRLSAWARCRADGREGWVPHRVLDLEQRAVRIAPASPFEPDVLGLLEEHLDDMRRTSPPESVHALDPAALAADGVIFVTARDDDGALLGCGALKALADGSGEIKSMRTAPAARGRGVATTVLGALLDRARAAGMGRVALETGTQPFFDPAVRLYLRHGFAPCGPFADYGDDPNSRYLARTL